MELEVKGTAMTFYFVNVARALCIGLWRFELTCFANPLCLIPFSHTRSIASVLRFRDILTTDESYVDLSSLREAAKGGVPESVRGDVWRHILGLDELCSTGAARDELKRAISAERDPTLASRVASDVETYLNRHPSLRTKAARLRMRALLNGYVSTKHPARQYRPGLASIMGVVMSTMDTRTDAYFVFSKVCDLAGCFAPAKAMGQRMSHFLALFRRFLPNLHNLFQQEQLNPNLWARPWLKDAFSSSLPIHCVCRLWDKCLSTKEGFDLIPFVSVVILGHLEETLLELDQDELYWRLRHLPPSLDMDWVILQADNIKAIARFK